MYEVVKKVEGVKVDYTRFADRETAEDFADFAQACSPLGTKYEVVALEE